MSEVERLKKAWTQNDETEIDGAISLLLEHRNGKKFLWWLLQIGRVGMQPYAGNALNTAFGCGELNVGQKILDRIIEVSPDGYIEMMKENQSERRQRDADLGRATDADRRYESGERTADGAED